MSKKRKKSKKSSKKIYIWILLVVFLVISSFVGGYYVAKSTIKPKVIHKQDIKTKEALRELQKLVDENIKSQNKIINQNLNKKNIKYNKEENKTSIINSEAVDYHENNTNTTTHTNPKPIFHTNKPKLVIIMDDMSFGYEVKKLKKLKINITPSFFPPSAGHPNTAVYAKEFRHYMVHLPMQAMNPNFKEEPNTLHTNSTVAYITQRILFVKKEFPRDKFINNHTGSKFTANLNAMKRFYKILDKYHLVFVDSRTTSHTKAPIVAKEFGQILLSRDVFLDNKPNVKYIQNQLKQAIRIAKRRGYAIAICHPHPKTFEALSKSKKILKNVQVIYIDELYKLYKQNKI